MTDKLEQAIAEMLKAKQGSYFSRGASNATWERMAEDIAQAIAEHLKHVGFLDPTGYFWPKDGYPEDIGWTPVYKFTRQEDKK